MVKFISREQIWNNLGSGIPMTLVEALPEKYYRQGHLPGALHLPHDEVLTLASGMLPDKNAFVVVYCASTPCQNSRIAAETLMSMGYTNVFEYAEGKQDWSEAGLPLEGRL